MNSAMLPRMKWVVGVVGCSAALLACSASPSSQEPSSTSTSSAGSSSSEGAASSETAASNDATTPGTSNASEETADPGVIWDVAGGIAESTAGSTGERDEPCRKVDVIISIDASSSMFEELDALQGPVFDSFPNTLLDIANGLDDFHLGVIDACNNPAFLHDTGVGGFCDFSTGKNFMESTSPDLIDEYHCVTDLDEFLGGYMGMPDFCSGNNDNEQPANTAADVVSPPAVDEENDDFLRDDAVLFIVAITDEDEQPVPVQSAQQIADKIIDAKGTINNVVFLGIAGMTNCTGPYGSASAGVFMQEVADIFVQEERGLFWDLCAGDLEGAFQAALPVVDSACVDFEPPQ